jgi:gluconolactonase
MNSLFLKMTLLVGMLCVASIPSYAAQPSSSLGYDFKPHIEILDARAKVLLDSAAIIEIRSEGHQWTEGPLWIEEGKYLLFSDIPDNQIMKFDPQSGTSIYLEPAGATGLVAGDDLAGSNGLLLNQKNQLVVTQQGDRRIAIMDAPLSAPSPRFITLTSDYNHKRLNSPNDGVFHSNGNLYFTDPPYGLKNGLQDKRKQLDFQGIYLLKSNTELVLLDDSVNYPNGILFTGDEKTLIVAVSDSDYPRWMAYDLQQDGRVKNKRVFFDASELVGKPGEQGLPDGMALHSSGVIFATGPGGVWLFTADGEVLAKIRTGQLSSNCALTADEKTLYVTADDYLLSVSLR